MLDDALSQIAATGKSLPTDQWVRTFAKQRESVQSLLIDRIVVRGLFVRGKYDRPRMFGFRGSAEEGRRTVKEVRRRVGGVLVCGEIPDPCDIMIIGLVDICGFWHSLLDPI
ncbi:MAG: hypothetical protein OXI01_19965 [Albidovulum sp.]|nr:hypothetical protein [Albidovulum sp.]